MDFSKGPKNEFEIAVVNEPSVFEFGIRKEYFIKPHIAMIKVLTRHISYSTKRRHKGGVNSNNTSSDFCVRSFLLYIFLCLQYCFRFMTVIFGEMDKWVPMSPKRVLSISWTNETVIAPLQGAANETFDFWYILGSKMDMVTCRVSSNGSAIFKMDKTLGIATCG